VIFLTFATKLRKGLLPPFSLVVMAAMELLSDNAHTADCIAEDE
jgi:hypothetical protein